MDRTETTTLDQRDLESAILGNIVDAMLDAEHDLKDASVREWQRILVESCRRRKRQPSASMA